MVSGIRLRLWGCTSRLCISNWHILQSIDRCFERIVERGSARISLYFRTLAKLTRLARGWLTKVQVESHNRFSHCACAGLVAKGQSSGLHPERISPTGKHRLICLRDHRKIPQISTTSLGLPCVTISAYCFGSNPGHCALYTVLQLGRPIIATNGLPHLTENFRTGRFRGSTRSQQAG